VTDQRDWNAWASYMWVVAHPDDAEFSYAGTIAKLTKQGRRVVIIQVTSGDKGTIDPYVSPEGLARIREAEELAAATRLGVDEVVFLRCEDGELTPDLQLREHIVKMIRTHRPDVLVTHDPFRPYALHPDHRAVGFAALDAVYPTARDPHYFPEHLRAGLEPHKTAEIWFFNCELPDLVVDITETIEDKLDALRCHKTQVGDGEEMAPRVRERNAELAANEPFDLGEAFKVVQMRR
jgi:LmbE family N-acetylglucosaminyl deacetylase